MSHWRLHPVTRIVVITVVVLVAVFIVVTFAYRGASPRPPGVVAQEEKAPATATCIVCQRQGPASEMQLVPPQGGEYQTTGLPPKFVCSDDCMRELHAHPEKHSQQPAEKTPGG